MTGTKLEVLPSRSTSWGKWKKLHPSTLVLSTDTGFKRNYDKDPYESYHRSPLAWFGLGGGGGALDDKELVFGIEVGEKSKAYPLGALSKTASPFKDIVSNRKILVYFDTDSRETHATDAQGGEIPGIITYWFVWHSFHPDTDILKLP